MPNSWNSSGPRFSTWAFANHAFLNDIVNQISFCSYHLYLYADDVQLYISCHPTDDFPDCIAHLNEDLSRIQLCTVANQLSINSSKSQATLVNPNTSFTVATDKFGWYTENKTLLESSNRNFLDRFQVINYLNQANIT
jgi:hypothetical protein